MNLDQLTAVGESMHEELGREYYRTGAGLKAVPEFQAIYAKHDAVASDEALELARGSGSPVLLEWVLGVRIGRKVAPLEERRLTWEGETVIRVDERAVPYLRVPIELANNDDREYRRRLDAERTRAVAAGLNPLLADRFALERDEVARLGLGDYVQTVGALAEIDLAALGRDAGTFLASTDALYEDCLARLVRRRLGTGLSGLTRSDAAWVFRANEYDRAFDPGEMVTTATKQMDEMGLDATQAGRVRVDTEERPGKQPRAFCVPVRVPQEVYLVLRPSGGHSDYRTFWHELGHAMHFAGVDPALPFAARRLGDNSVTEGFAMLWDHLTMHPGWLGCYTGLGEREIGNLVFELAVSELHLLRRYAAKLGYELGLYRGDPATVGGEYADRLSRATRFRYQPENGLVDVDPGFYAARYLRAWQLEAALAAALTAEHDADWWRNPRAGAAVQALWSQGQATPADRLLRELTGHALTFTACQARLEALLD